MSKLNDTIRDLVLANRILASEGVVDFMGHISVRHPERPDRFLMSCSRAPSLVVIDDIMEYDLDCNPVEPDKRAIYIERPIHGAIYAARPDVMAVSHNHANEILPFTMVYGAKLRAVIHAGHAIGREAPLWDMRIKFGDTNTLVSTMDHGRDLAQVMGPSEVVLMRNHGCAVGAPSLAKTVFNSIYLKVNAELQREAMKMGEMSYLTDAEIRIITDTYAKYPAGVQRAWEYWLSRVDMRGL